MAPDIIINTAALNAAKKACNNAAKKVEEAKLTVAMAKARPFEL